MNIACPSCSFKKSIDDALVPKAEKFIATCPKCTHRFTVNRFTTLSRTSNGAASVSIDSTEAHSLGPDNKTGTITDTKTDTAAHMPAKKRHLKIVDTKRGLRDEKKGMAAKETAKEATAELHALHHEHKAHGGHGHGKEKVCCGNCSGKCDGSGKGDNKDGLKSEAASLDTTVDSSVGTITDTTSKSIDKKESNTETVASTAGGSEERGGNGTGSDSGSKETAPRRLSFHGTGGTLFGIYIVNILLTIATLGIYSFWGKAKVRKYLYSGSAFMNERFSYTGTGKELLMGKIRATGLIILIFGVPQSLSQFVHPALALLALPGLLFFPPIARTLTMRYRLSRSNWRSIQFSFRGTVNEAIKLYLSGTLKSIVTLGFYYPKYYIKKQTFWRSNSWYGTTPFKYNGRTRGVRKTILSGSLLTLLTFGIYGFWFSARLAKYNWAHTTYKGLSFDFTATGRDILNYQVGNILLIIFTLGLGMAWVQKRKLDFNFKHIKIEGDIDFAEIAQSAERAGATGESLAPGLDIDFAI